jgi:hypothetical protein
LGIDVVERPAPADAEKVGLDTGERRYYLALMVRVQIQLTRDQQRSLTEWARRQGISLAEAARRCIDDMLGREGGAGDRREIARRALAACGRFRDRKARDVAEKHDKYLAETYRA